MVIGSVYMFAGTTVPSGFLLCDGSDVSRTTYAELFSTIGTAYGAGDGSTTFNLPDLSGRVAIGNSQTYSIGSTGGEETHSLNNSEMPEHLHGVPSHGHTSSIVLKTPTLSHTVTQPAYNYERPNGTTNMGNARPTITSYTGTSSVAATRSGNIAISNHPSTALTVTGGIDDCAAFNTDPAGNGSGHSNMQPYITLNYVIYAGE